MEPKPQCLNGSHNGSHPSTQPPEAKKASTSGRVGAAKKEVRLDVAPAFVGQCQFHYDWPVMATNLCSSFRRKSLKASSFIRVGQSCLHHSDRGVAFCSFHFQELYSLSEGCGVWVLKVKGAELVTCHKLGHLSLPAPKPFWPNHVGSHHSSQHTIIPYLYLCMGIWYIRGGAGIPVMSYRYAIR